MTPKESASIYSAILTLADCADTMTGNERKTMIALMESLNMMAGGARGGNRGMVAVYRGRRSQTACNDELMTNLEPIQQAKT
jgi:hypothetical protein